MENKENVGILQENILDMRVMSEESLLTRKRKKGEGCNMRKSLAWNSAFFTEEGVLDADELSSFGGSLRYCGKKFLLIEDRVARSTTASHSSTTTEVLNLKENDNAVNELCRDSKQEKKEGLKLRSSGQEGYLGTKDSTAVQSSKTMKTLAPKQGGCPPPSNLQKKLTKSTTQEFDSLSKCKATKGELGLKNGSLKSIPTPLSAIKTGNMTPSDAGVKHKSNSGCITTSLKTINQSSGMSSFANIQSSQDISDFMSFKMVPERKLSTDIHMKPSRLRMPTPSLKFFSKAEGVNSQKNNQTHDHKDSHMEPAYLPLQRAPELYNNIFLGGSDEVKHSTLRRVLSNPSVPHHNIPASYYACNSNSKAKELVKLDVKSTSDCLSHSFQEDIQNYPTMGKVEPSVKIDITSNGSVMFSEDSVLSNSPLPVGRMKYDLGSKTFADVKVTNLLERDDLNDLHTFKSQVDKDELLCKNWIKADSQGQGCYAATSSVRVKNPVSKLEQDVLEKAELVNISGMQVMYGNAQTSGKGVQAEKVEMPTKTCLKPFRRHSQGQSSALYGSSLQLDDLMPNLEWKALVKAEIQETSERDDLNPLLSISEEGKVCICSENSSLHKTGASSHGNDSLGEGNNSTRNNVQSGVMFNLAEKALAKGEIEDKPEQASLKDLLCSMNSYDQIPFKSQLHSLPEKEDLLFKTDLEPGRNVNQTEISEPTEDPLCVGYCGSPGNSELLDSPLQCVPNSNLFPVGDGKKMQVKENVLHGIEQDPYHRKLNVKPFSDEWLALVESAGEELLKMKSGAVQNSPPDKTVPEPSPWSPGQSKQCSWIELAAFLMCQHYQVKRNVRGPFDCTKKCSGIPPSNSNVG